MSRDKDPTRRFNPADRRRPRRLEEASSAEISFPLAWIVIGGLAGLIVIGLVGLGVVNLLGRSAITPTPQVLPPLLEPLGTPSLPASTGAPTPATGQTTTPPTVVTPVQTPPAAGQTPALPQPSPATSIQVDGYVVVTGTAGLGLSMRAGPGRNNVRLGLAEDGVKLLILDGPREDEAGEDYTWWFVRHPDGTEGWVVEDFLSPSGEP